MYLSTDAAPDAPAVAGKCTVIVPNPPAGISAIDCGTGEPAAASSRAEVNCTLCAVPVPLLVTVMTAWNELSPNLAKVEVVTSTAVPGTTGEVPLTVALSAAVLLFAVLSVPPLRLALFEIARTALLATFTVTVMSGEVPPAGTDPS